jgi:hypothetical protein
MALPSAAVSQDVTTGSATATVQTALTVSATAALAFGTVYQGVAKSVANNVAEAGVFTITGQGGAGISLYMQLPDYLSTATGDDRMVISFGTTDASIDSTSNVDPTAFGAGWANQDPHNLPAGVEIGIAASQAAVFLGGTVNPSVDQTAGAYTGDIILTVAYNGS